MRPENIVWKQLIIELESRVENYAKAKSGSEKEEAMNGIRILVDSAKREGVYWASQKVLRELGPICERLGRVDVGFLAD